MRVLLLSLAALTLLAACRTDDPDVPEAPPVGEAAVERFRAEMFLAAGELDAALAALEADAEAQTDTLARDVYRSEIARLRQERLRLQARVDSLRPAGADVFAAQQDSARAQLARLETRVRRARFTLAPTPGALRAAAA
ncbi:MAG: hypothetical protein ACK41D_07745, partial [Rubricoccaceae bacterium]